MERPPEQEPRSLEDELLEADTKLQEEKASEELRIKTEKERKEAEKAAQEKAKQEAADRAAKEKAEAALVPVRAAIASLESKKRSMELLVNSLRGDEALNVQESDDDAVEPGFKGYAEGVAGRNASSKSKFETIFGKFKGVLEGRGIRNADQLVSSERKKDKPSREIIDLNEAEQEKGDLAQSDAALMSRLQEIGIDTKGLGAFSYEKVDQLVSAKIAETQAEIDAAKKLEDPATREEALNAFAESAEKTLPPVALQRLDYEERSAQIGLKTPTQSEYEQPRLNIQVGLFGAKGLNDNAAYLMSNTHGRMDTELLPAQSPLRDKYGAPIATEIMARAYKARLEKTFSETPDAEFMEKARMSLEGLSPEAMDRAHRAFEDFLKKAQDLQTLVESKKDLIAALYPTRENVFATYLGIQNKLFGDKKDLYHFSDFVEAVNMGRNGLYNRKDIDHVEVERYIVERTKKIESLIASVDSLSLESAKNRSTNMAAVLDRFAVDRPKASYEKSFDLKGAASVLKASMREDGREFERLLASSPEEDRAVMQDFRKFAFNRQGWSVDQIFKDFVATREKTKGELKEKAFGVVATEIQSEQLKQEMLQLFSGETKRSLEKDFDGEMDRLGLSAEKAQGLSAELPLLKSCFKEGERVKYYDGQIVSQDIMDLHYDIDEDRKTEGHAEAPLKSQIYSAVSEINDNAGKNDIPLDNRWDVAALTNAARIELDSKKYEKAPFFGSEVWRNQKARLENLKEMGLEYAKKSETFHERSFTRPNAKRLFTSESYFGVQNFATICLREGALDISRTGNYRTAIYPKYFSSLKSLGLEGQTTTIDAVIGEFKDVLKDADKMLPPAATDLYDRYKGLKDKIKQPARR